MRVDQPSPRVANGSVTPWSRPACDRQPITKPSLRDRAVGFGTGLVSHTIDYAIVGAVVSVVGSNALGQLGGLIGAGAFAALSLVSGIGGAIRPSREVEPRYAPTASTRPSIYQPVGTPSSANASPAHTWVGDVLASDVTRTAAVLATSTVASMGALTALDWPATWGLALLPGLIITLTASVGMRRMRPAPTPA